MVALDLDLTENTLHNLNLSFTAALRVRAPMGWIIKARTPTGVEFTCIRLNRIGRQNIDRYRQRLGDAGLGLYRFQPIQAGG